ncbi:MAG: hypothetical protein J5J00_05515 [Deltaproteobacteria bacterium]|nr:hypothetical protein [Deltaproteobacteria bacterium]
MLRFLTLAITAVIFAFPYPPECRSEELLLLPPGPLERYNKDVNKLSESERWRIMIHGLRMAPLHPEHWGIRRTERTENRRLVPMRPFVLRQSTDPHFFFEEISFRAKFVNVNERQMLKHPHAKDPVFDIFFGSEYEQSKGQIVTDRGYLLRLTAFPGFKSGIYYQSLGKLEPIQLLPQALLSTREEYHVAIYGRSDTVSVHINGSEAATVKRNSINKGIVALMTGWHPVGLSDLKVLGRILRDDGQMQTVNVSGLITLPRIKKKK